jgi:2,4-dienoyl-CoA reductase (NADPH2)
MIERDIHSPFRFRELDDLRAAISSLGLDIRADDDLSPLAQPVEVAGRIIPNSMAIQPMEGCDGTPDGAPGELTFRRYRRFAAGGAGLLWVEACAVVHEGRANPRQLWIHERTKDDFARLVDEARKAASESMGERHRPFMVLQLTHSGRYSRPGSAPAPIIAYHDPHLDPTRGISPDQPVISDDELKALMDAYVGAARLAFETGFDAVDVKAAHRYLINELLAAHTRKGEFGGSYENRTRFLKTVIGRVLDEGKGIVTCRLGIHDAHPYPYGWGMDRDDTTAPNLDEPKRLIRELHDMGLSLINITMGNPYYNPHVNRPYDRPIEGAECPDEHPLVGMQRLIGLTREVRADVPEMVVVGSGYSWLRNLWPYVAAAEMKAGSIQIVGVGRQVFAFPGFAREIIETYELDRRHTCIACSSCTQIMRDGGMTGCVPFDSEVYGPIYREGRCSSLEYVRAQASRCRDCFDPRCTDGCPAGVDIPGFVRALADGDIRRSYEILRERNVLPELCGYVCPAEVQCQGHCIENVFSQNPVPIRGLQAFVSRVAREKGWALLPTAASTGKRIAVVGAGPAGLSCAARLLQHGHTVDIFDPTERLGGVAVSAIPAERLEAAAFDAEIESVFADVMGERLFLHGNGLSDYPTLDGLAEEYDAVFLAMGLGESPSLAADRPPGVEDAISFLNRCKRGEARIPQQVAVLGGGNTAIDAATTAARLGAWDVYLVYRRSFGQMPAWPAERDEAMREGVHFLLLTQPLSYELDERGHVCGIRIARTILGEPDESWRRSPVVVPGSESVLEVDLVLEALGQSIPAETAALLQGVELARGLIQVDDEGRTSRPGVYAGGDITNGGSTVVQAVADGMRAADAIHCDFGP